MIHVNICGYPGAGKSTAATFVSLRYCTVWIPRVTTRPPRPTEGQGREYIFVTEVEFDRMLKSGELLRRKKVSGPKMIGEKEYRRGTPAPKFWPQPEEDTELVLSVFGKAAPLIKRFFAPDMIDICLVASDLVLLERLAERVDGDVNGQHRETIRKYRLQKLERRFSHKIDTSHLTPDEVADRIALIAGLARKTKAA